MDFDPFGLLARHMPEKRIHRIINFLMVAILIGFFAHRIRQYPYYAVKTLWFVETLLFIVLIIAFMKRKAPINRSRGLREIVVPLIGSSLPFALLLSPPAPGVTGNRPLLIGALWWMTAATSLTVAGMWSLRHAFSITVEARILNTRGPYRLVRHPIYLGEMLAAAGVAFIRWSPINAMLLAFFIAIQLYRSRLEEVKLSNTFPEYHDFAARSRWFW